MLESQTRFANLGIALPTLLLPGPQVDLEAWAVIACDQFTQDQGYWQKVEERVGPRASTLRLIFPEIYLDEPQRRERIQSIQHTMRSYLDLGVFGSPLSACMYLERATPSHPLRRGLVLLIDLERYDWSPGARPWIRATEGTVQERIPPRMEIRRGAALETPHVILLVDDDQETLLEGLGARVVPRKPTYETTLMLGGGAVRGWRIDTAEDLELIATSLEALAQRSKTRYLRGAEASLMDDPFLFAVGDGNHSLATAKAVWEEYKALHEGAIDLLSHPARWALVEIENLYDRGIEFEPIHRVMFGARLDDIVELLSSLPDYSAQGVKTIEAMVRLVGDRDCNRTRYGIIAKNGAVVVETSAPGIATGPLQPLLDRWVGQKTGRSIDYLHGTEETLRVSLETKDSAPRVGILLPPVEKGDLFFTVARSGPLPRKSFSMGEAVEKRYYLECRALFR